MLNKKLSLIILLILFLISFTTVYAENIQVGTLNFEIPSQYEGGNNTQVKLGTNVYTRFIGENFFRIFVYSDTENIDTYVGYMIKEADTAEYTYINNRPVLLLTEKNPYVKTVLIFESQSKLVTIEIPNSYNLTDTGRDIVNSAPSSTLSDTDFDKLMLKALNQYEVQKQADASSSYSYSSGYSDGSRSGYNSGYHRGTTRGIIFGYLIGRM